MTIGKISADLTRVALLFTMLTTGLGSAPAATAGRSKGRIVALWAVVAASCTLSTVAGFALAEVLPAELVTGINGFAAGALLVMLTDSMIPDAEKKAPGKAGLATVLGFAAAMSLSLLQ